MTQGLNPLTMDHQKALVSFGSRDSVVAISSSLTVVIVNEFHALINTNLIRRIASDGVLGDNQATVFLSIIAASSNATVLQLAHTIPGDRVKWLSELRLLDCHRTNTISFETILKR